MVFTSFFFFFFNTRMQIMQSVVVDDILNRRAIGIALIYDTSWSNWNVLFLRPCDEMPNLKIRILILTFGSSGPGLFSSSITAWSCAAGWLATSSFFFFISKGQKRYHARVAVGFYLTMCLFKVRVSWLFVLLSLFRDQTCRSWCVWGRRTVLKTKSHLRCCSLDFQPRFPLMRR